MAIVRKCDVCGAHIYSTYGNRLTVSGDMINFVSEKQIYNPNESIVVDLCQEHMVRFMNAGFKELKLIQQENEFYPGSLKLNG